MMRGALQAERACDACDFLDTMLRSTYTTANVP
jgi:hypothetical protein